ncbi:MAG: dihydropyrimidinase [Deltaproteobacteria bacterium]|nr:dihydropyrimidinase [Deltaproteobacteria bacterium]MBW1961558.1 dihydropyrimidinase [Deltaproteobacteria bacterium]MBW2152347.1 dihydropyrimidinase [Deltaproteobacteria bacterium]
MIRKIIAGAQVVLPTGTQQVDIFIENEKIAGIGKTKHFPRTDNLIDAKGMIVLPGLVDIHVHFLDRFMGTVSLHDFFTGTRAAAHGGVTTIIDFANQSKGDSLADAIQRKRAEADDDVVIDYGLHAEITDPTPSVLHEVRHIVRAGVPSFKVYTIYEGMMVDDGVLIELFEQTARYHGLVMVHAENSAIAQRLKQQFLSRGKTTALYHALSKPNMVEAEAIHRVVYLGRWLNAPLYIVHMSTREGNEIMEVCRKQGLPVFAETCPHYLCLTDNVYRRKDGINYIISPPLRKTEDIKALWKGLFNGSISVVSTDDASFSKESKIAGKDSFDKVPNGMAGVELRLPVLYSEGVRKRGMRLERLAELTSTNPARLFGLYPRKGVIQVGADADLVILHPEKEVTLGMKTTHMVTDFCSLEGWKVTGYPVMTIFRGSLIVENGTFLGRKGNGRFLRRKIDFNEIRTLR